MAEVRTDYRIALKDDFSKGLAGIRSQVNSFNVSLKNVGAGLAVGGGAFAALIKSSANLADELGKSAQRAGVTTETFSALRYGAKLADVDVTQLEGGLAKLGKTMASAAQGGKAANEAFSAIGVSFKNADGTLRGSADVFRDIAEKLSKLPDGATKTALAMQLFGRAGAQLIPLLNGGAEGIAEFTREAERMGLIVSTESAKAAEEFNDNLTRMQEAISGVAQKMTKELIGALADLSTEFIRAYTEGDGLLRVLTAIGTASSRVFEGSDQEKLGEALLEQIELEQKLAKLRTSRPTRGATGPDQGAIAAAEADLARVNREIAGLQVVLKPSQFGAAPVATKPAAAPDIALEDTAAATKAATEAEKAARALAKTQREARAAYNAGLRETLSMIDEEASAWESIDQQREAARQSVETGQERALRQLREFEALGFRPDSEEFGRKAIEVFNELHPEIDSADEKSKKLQNTFSDLGATFSSAFEDAILGGEKFSAVLEGLAKDIGRIVLRQTVTDPLASGLSDLFGNLGGGIGGFFKDLFGGFRASGGPVSAGRGYVVGEKGPELFFPGQSGAIEANGGITIVNIGAAPVRTEARNVNGKRQIHQYFADTAAGATAAGLLAPLGVSPQMASR